MNKVIIGSLSANIAGDHRYTDALRVEWNEDKTVTVSVFSTGAIGGMDGPGGATEPTPQATATTKPLPSAKDVMQLIKRYVNDTSYNFKRYGKPTKNFYWRGGARGLSMALCKRALDEMIEGAHPS